MLKLQRAPKRGLPTRSPGGACLTKWLSMSVWLLATTGHAADPAWWSAQGAVTTTHPPNPNAVVTQGQLKNFTVCATNELNVDLAPWGGAGDTLNNLWTTWQQDYATNGYATNTANPTYPYKPSDSDAVTVGQLKYIAGLIDAPLLAANYLTANPTWLIKDPAVDSHLANLGQLKTVFNFDLSLDPDNSGLPLWWEERYFNQTGVSATNLAPNGDGLTLLANFQQGINPLNYYSGLVPTLAKASVDPQTGNPNGLLPAALAVNVTAASGGPMIDAPITFQVVSGGGQLQTTVNSSLTGSCTVITDGNGQARAYFTLPNVQNATCQIQASAVGSSQSAVTFTAKSDNGTGTYAWPFAGSVAIETLNADGSEDLTWTNCPENTNPITLWNLVNNSWVYVTTVPAGTTTYHFATP